MSVTESAVVEALRKQVADYEQEYREVAVVSAQLLTNLQDRTREGDILRSRLTKVLAAYQALEVLHTASIAGASTAESEKAYAQARLNLETLDG